MFDSMESEDEGKKYGMGSAKIDKKMAMELVSKLKMMAEEAGCSPEEFMEKYSEGSEDESGDDKGGKIALIIAKMKAKKGMSEDEME